MLIDANNLTHKEAKQVLTMLLLLDSELDDIYYSLEVEEDYLVFKDETTDEEEEIEIDPECLSEMCLETEAFSLQITIDIIENKKGSPISKNYNIELYLFNKETALNQEYIITKEKLSSIYYFLLKKGIDIDITLAIEERELAADLNMECLSIEERIRLTLITKEQCKEDIKANGLLDF